MSKAVYIASPFRANDEHSIYTHESYARRAMKDSLLRGEAPIVPHLLYPMVLDDDNASDHRLAIRANDALILASELVVFYIDFGISAGMQAELNIARQYSKQLDIRSIGKWEAPAPIESPPEAIAVPSKSPQEADWDEPYPTALDDNEADVGDAPVLLPSDYTPGDRLSTLTDALPPIDD